MPLLFQAEIFVCSRLWINLWITPRNLACTFKYLTITELNKGILEIYQPQTRANVFPLFLKDPLLMWEKCG